MICHYKSKIYWRDAFKKKLSFLKTGFFRVKKRHFFRKSSKNHFFQKICMQSIILVFNKLTPTKMSMKTNFYPNLMSMEYFRAKNAFKKKMLMTFGFHRTLVSHDVLVIRVHWCLMMSL